MSTLSEITAIVAEVLEADPADVTPDADLIQTLGMDSVLAIDITTALEKHFKVTVPDADMGKMTSVGAIAELVESLKAKSA